MSYDTQYRMTEEKFIDQIMSYWLDKNGLVKTQSYRADSGNGVLYTSIAVMLCPQIKTFTQKFVDQCFTVAGCLKRTPGGQYGQEEWDDYLGLLASCILTGETYRPRRILSYGLTHLFIYNNDKKLEFKDWLGRYPQFDVILWKAAFPKLNFIWKPLAWIITKFFNAKPLENPGEYQLEWVFKMAFGFEPKTSESWGNIAIAFKKYYTEEHPFTLWAQEKERAHLPLDAQ